MPSYAVVPVKVRQYDSLLRCDRSSIKGYRVYCACGTRTPKRDTVRMAMLDYWKHEQSEHTRKGGV